MGVVMTDTSTRESNRRLSTDAFKVFAAVLVVCCVANGISYFVLSDGYGVRHVADGRIRWGVPFLVLDEGGFEGRSRFYWKGLAADALCGIVMAIFVAGLWYLMQKAGHDTRNGTRGEG